ncbi:MAG: MOSC domain-containing protein, partial [Acidobacteria bacterium]|nr:MOSC domain-containing protein [Acidobacteriota bacterium]NIM60450.1 MOSC domain-containing protein [Acidobacteriota bacterium]NIO60360.1 MOSC domain-containing protein [Acidobacteriota bacterium]NIQ31433.1 MOSC domain-containing protein [Acidobacteriota bacterium]NIQ86676.1 MOSC domain-containing protein [Acidobacteriota bacterium]
VGDNWKARGSGRTSDGTAHPEMQINIMNARVAQLVAQDPERRALAGDQLYLDLDLGAENLPPGTELEIGEAVLVVTDQPHLGCKKFVRRFGVEAMKFVNAVDRRHLNLRGINARVKKPGRIEVGDIARRRIPRR